MSMSGSDEQPQPVVGMLPEKPSLRDILLYQSNQDGQRLQIEDRRKAIGRFAYCLPQLMEAKDEKDFAENLMDALKENILDLSEEQRKMAHENIGLLFEELYRNHCINQSDFHAICLRCEDLLPNDQKEAFLKKMDALDKMIQAKFEKDKEKKPRKVVLSEIEIEKIKQTAESIRAHTIYLFSKLTPMDFYGQKWAKKKGTKLNEIAEFFNKASMYIASDILNQNSVGDVEQRAVFWGNVLEHALDTKDYNTAMTILSAFNSTSVDLLKITSLEDFNGKKNLEAALEHANRILTNEKNYANYKKALEADFNENRSSIPYFGVSMTEYTFIDDGNPSKIGENYNYTKGSFLSNLISTVADLQTKSNKESYKYCYYGNLVESIQDSIADVKSLDTQRNLIKLDKAKRNYGAVDSFLSNMIYKHYSSEKNTFEFPLYISIRVKKDENDQQELVLPDDQASHQFIQGELAYQLTNSRENNQEIDLQKMLLMIDALSKNAQDRGLSQEFIKNYQNLQDVVSNRINLKDIKIQEDQIILMALKHAIVHDLPEQENIKKKIVDPDNKDGTIKASVKERVSLFNKRLKAIDNELSDLKKSFKNLKPQDNEYQKNLEKLQQKESGLKAEAANYAIELDKVKNAYFDMPIFSEAHKFKEMVNNGIHKSTEILGMKVRPVQFLGQQRSDSTPQPQMKVPSSQMVKQDNVEKEIDISKTNSDTKQQAVEETKTSESKSKTIAKKDQSVFALIDRTLNPYPEVKAEVDEIRREYFRIIKRTEDAAAEMRKMPNLNKEQQKAKWAVGKQDLYDLKRLQDRLNFIKDKESDGFNRYASDFASQMNRDIGNLEKSKEKIIAEQIKSINAEQPEAKKNIDAVADFRKEFEALKPNINDPSKNQENIKKLNELKGKLEKISSLSSARYRDNPDLVKLSNEVMLAHSNINDKIRNQPIESQLESVNKTTLTNPEKENPKLTRSESAPDLSKKSKSHFRPGGRSRED